jgi:hypothetical protein
MQSDAIEDVAQLRTEETADESVLFELHEDVETEAQDDLN